MPPAECSQGLEQAIADAAAIFRAIGKAAAYVGKYRYVRAGEAEQSTQQQSVIDTLGIAVGVTPGECGMGHEQQPVIVGQRARRVQSHDHRAGEYPWRAQPVDVFEIALEFVRRRCHVGQIQATPAGLPVGIRHGPIAGFGAPLECLEIIVDQILIVLDDVPAAEGKVPRHACQGLDGCAAGLERGGEERPCVDANELSQPVHAVARSLELRQNRLGKMHVQQPNAGIDGHVSEEKIHQLGDLSAGQRRRVADGDIKGAREARVRRDPIDAADHTVDDGGIGDQCLRQLHGLLVGDGAGDGRGLAFAAGDPVDGLNTLIRHVPGFGALCWWRAG